MKRLISLIMVLATFNVFAQTNQKTHNKKFDLRVGIGYLFMGSGDYSGISFENELNYQINNYFSTSASINMSRSMSGAPLEGVASCLGGNLNIFISPFKNNKLNDFRIGGGFAFYNISDVYVSSIRFVDGEQQKYYTTTEETTIGGSIIIEDTFNINGRFLIGMKAFMQPYTNGDINSGIMVKFGVKL